MNSVCGGRCDNSVMFSKVEPCSVRFYINLHDPSDPEKVRENLSLRSSKAKQKNNHLNNEIR